MSRVRRPSSFYFSDLCLNPVNGVVELNLLCIYTMDLSTFILDVNTLFAYKKSTFFFIK